MRPRTIHSPCKPGRANRYVCDLREGDFLPASGTTILAGPAPRVRSGRVNLIVSGRSDTVRTVSWNARTVVCIATPEAGE